MKCSCGKDLTNESVYFGKCTECYIEKGKGNENSN